MKVFRVVSLGSAIAASTPSIGCGVAWGIPDRELDERVDCTGGVCACTRPFSDCDADPANGCEADLSLDGKNCGACGHDCQGGECADEACQPVEIAPATDVARVAVDGTHVYWSTASSCTNSGGTLVCTPSETTVNRVSRLGGDVEILDTLEDGQSPKELRVAGSDCYWVDGASVRTRKVDGSEPARTLGVYGTLEIIGGLDVDDEYVYFSGMDGVGAYSFVARIRIRGGEIEPLAQSSGPLARGLVVDTMNAYWIDGNVQGLSPIVAMPLEGGPAAPLGESAVALSLDATNLYWVGANPADALDADSVWRMPLAGGQPVALASEQSLSELALDKKHLFWIQNGTEPVSLMSVDLEGGDPVEIARLPTAPQSNIAVDDTAIYWASADRIVKLAQ